MSHLYQYPADASLASAPGAPPGAPGLARACRLSGDRDHEADDDLRQLLVGPATPGQEGAWPARRLPTTQAMLRRSFSEKVVLDAST